MKTTLLSLLALGSLAHASPPVLSLTQAALQKVDPDIKPDQPPFPRPPVRPNGFFRGIPPKANS